jgi:hypothetical protein
VVGGGSEKTYCDYDGDRRRLPAKYDESENANVNVQT